MQSFNLVKKCFYVKLFIMKLWWIFVAFFPLDQKVGVRVDVDSSNQEFMNSVFYLHGNRNKDDSKEFDDLIVRAKKLALK